MRFSCARSTLSQALKIAGRAVRPGSPFPVSQTIRFRAVATGEDEQITLYATDNEIALHTCFSAHVEEAGAVCVPAKRLGEIVNALPAACEVRLSCSESLGITVKGGTKSGSTFRLTGVAAEEMPTFPSVQDETGISLPESLWHQMINRVVYAASRETARPILNGACLTISGSTVELAATDALKLAVFRQAFDGDLGRDLRVVIPRETLLEMLHLLKPESDAEISLWIDENQITLGTSRGWLMSRLIAGNFPDYYTIVPTNVETWITLFRADLLDSLKRVEIVAKERYFRANCSFESGQTRIESRAGDEEVEEKVESDYAGEIQSITLHAGQMISILETIDTDRVCLGLNGPVRPVLIRPHEGEQDYFAVNSPMTLE